MTDADWLLVGEYQVNGGPWEAMWTMGQGHGPRSAHHAEAWFRRDVLFAFCDRDDVLVGRNGAASVRVRDVRLYALGASGWRRVERSS